MAFPRAAWRSTGASSTDPALWASLSRRQAADLTVPGASIGVLGGLIAGGLAAIGGLPFLASLVAGAGLGIPLALAGAGYEVLVARGTVPLGPLTPMALYWMIAFPVVRMFHAGVFAMYVGSAIAVPHGWLAFFAYQALVSVGFGIGFWWLHSNFAPRWWFHLREKGNPVAEHYLYQLLSAGVVQRYARGGVTTDGRSR